jgi:hypothetical protein
MGASSTQCAWCRRFYDAGGFVDHAPTSSDLINHGICYVCLDVALREEVARLVAEGDHREARVAERRRVATATRLARQREEASRERARLSTNAARVAAELVATAEEQSKANRRAVAAPFTRALQG